METIIAIVGLLSLGGLVVFFVRQPRQAELRAILEISQSLDREIDQAIERLRVIRYEALPIYIAEANISLDHCISNRLQGLESRTATVVDGNFFGKAARAALPNQNWKDDFKQHLVKVSSQLIDYKELDREVAAITDMATGKLQNRVASDLSEFDFRSLHLSNEARQTLGRDSDRLERFLGPGSELSKLLRINVRRDAAVSTTLIGGGTLGLIAVHSLDTHSLAHIAGILGSEIVGTHVVDEVAKIMVEWLVQEFGENVLLELAEIAAAAMTAFGLVFAVWKVYRYVGLAKRLFIDQEPLVKMRESIRENCHRSLENTRDEVSGALATQANAWLANIEGHLRSVRVATKEREVWAKSRIWRLRQAPDIPRE